MRHLIHRRERSRRVRILQLGIWLTFVASVVLMSVMSAKVMTPAAGSSSASSQAATVVTGTSGSGAANSASSAIPAHQAMSDYLDGGGTSTLTSASNCPSAALDAVGYSAGYGATVPPGCAGDGGTKYTTGANYINLLPAFRWANAISLYSNTGSNPISSTVLVIMTAMAEIIFAFATWLWWLLLEVVKFGLTADLLKASAHAIDEGFASLAGALGSSGLLIIMAVVIGLIGVRAVLGGHLGKVFHIFLAFLIPLAVVEALASEVNPHAADKGYTSPAGAPAWIAEQGSNFLGTTVNAIAGGFQGLSGNVANPADPLSSVDGDANKAPNCNQYDNALYKQYDAYAATASSGGADEMSAVPSISYLWQDAFLNYWQEAQFGNDAYDSLGTCHLLDNQALVTAPEISAIDTIAYANIPGSTSSKPGVPNANTEELYGSNGSKSFETMLFGYMACQYVGGSGPDIVNGWTYRPGWNILDGSSQSGDPGSGPLGFVEGRSSGGPNSATPGNCASWWSTGDTQKSFSWLTSDALFGGLVYASSTPNLTTADQQGAAQAYDSVDSTWGHNAGTRLLSAIMAAVTAMIYLWGLGPLALGSALSQVGLILTLILLPATLYLVAWPSRRKGEAAGIGQKLLRMTGGFFVARFTILLCITFLIAAISVLETVAGAMPSFDAFSQMFIPVAAILTLRALLKACNLGNLTSMSGALTLPTAAAMKISGDEKMTKAVVAGGQKIGDKTGINRLDAFAKRNTFGVPRRGVDASKKFAKETWGEAKKVAATAATAAVVVGTGGAAAAPLLGAGAAGAGALGAGALGAGAMGAGAAGAGAAGAGAAAATPSLASTAGVWLGQRVKGAATSMALSEMADLSSDSVGGGSGPIFSAGSSGGPVAAGGPVVTPLSAQSAYDGPLTQVVELTTDASQIRAQLAHMAQDIPVTLSLDTEQLGSIPISTEGRTGVAREASWKFDDSGLVKAAQALTGAASALSDGSGQLTAAGPDWSG
jgi:hypothetical protein